VTHIIHNRIFLEWRCIFVGLGNSEGGAHDFNIFHNSHYSKYPEGLGRHGTAQGHGMVF
jgi:hypothetical protein